MFNRRCVIQRLQREMAGVGDKARKSTPRPCPRFVMALDALGALLKRWRVKLIEKPQLPVTRLRL